MQLIGKSGITTIASWLQSENISRKDLNVRKNLQIPSKSRYNLLTSLEFAVRIVDYIQCYITNNQNHYQDSRWVILVKDFRYSN